jgi:hypothetical protein
MKSLWILRQKTWKDVNSASVSKKYIETRSLFETLALMTPIPSFSIRILDKILENLKIESLWIFFNRMWLFWFYWISLIHFLTRFLVSFLLRDLLIYFDASIFILRNENALKNYQRASGLKHFWTKYKKPWNRGVQPKLFMRPWISFLWETLAHHFLSKN